MNTVREPTPSQRVLDLKELKLFLIRVLLEQVRRNLTEELYSGDGYVLGIEKAHAYLINFYLAVSPRTHRLVTLPTFEYSPTQLVEEAIARGIQVFLSPTTLSIHDLIEMGNPFFKDKRWTIGQDDLDTLNASQLAILRDVSARVAA